MIKEEDRLSKDIIGAAVEMHQHLGSRLPARLVSGRFQTLRSLRLVNYFFLLNQSICVKWRACPPVFRRDETPYLIQVRDSKQVLNKELRM